MRAGRVDGFTDLASPLCARSVIAFMNVPGHLADAMIEHGSAFEHAQFRFDAERVEAENRILYDLARQLVAHRRAHSLDPDEDIVSGLLAGAVDGVPIDDELATGSFRQILIAGHGAPALVMASSFAHLAGDAGQTSRASPSGRRRVGQRLTRSRARPPGRRRHRRRPAGEPS
jgi:cytochrome P450